MSFRTSSVKTTPALNFINFFHSVRLVALREACTSGKQGGRSESFFHRPSSTTFSSYCFYAFQPSSLEEIHFSDVRNAATGIGRRHLVTSRLPSLQFWLVFEDRSSCSCISSAGTSELAWYESATGNGARNSFAVSSVPKSFRFSVIVIYVGSELSSSRPSSSSSSLAVRNGSATVGLSGARSSMKPCCV